MKLTYHRCGDYLLPDLGLDERDKQPIGKYGMLRMDYLKNHRPILYNQLLLSGELIPHLVSIDTACNDFMERAVTEMAKQEGITEELKAIDQMRWVGLMNNIHACAEEIIMNDYIYN